MRRFRTSLNFRSMKRVEDFVQTVVGWLRTHDCNSARHAQYTYKLNKSVGRDGISDKVLPGLQTT